MINNISAIHHVAIICSDYNISKNFYSNILGLKIVSEIYRKERNSYKLNLSLPDGSQIELFSFPHPPARVSRPEAQGLRHLAFSVRNLDLEISRLNSYQIETEPIRKDEFTGRRFTFFHDPDGLPLELYEVDNLHPAHYKFE